MTEYWIKEIKGQLNDILEIIWVDCDILDPFWIFAICENNINIPVLRFGYKTGSNIPLYVITEGCTGVPSLNRLFKNNLLIHLKPYTSSKLKYSN